MLPGIFMPTGAVASVQIFATSYEMPNGGGDASGGTYNYWDGSYSGSGSTTTDAAALSGGLGDLTDGIIATETLRTATSGVSRPPDAVRSVWWRCH